MNTDHPLWQWRCKKSRLFFSSFKGGAARRFWERQRLENSYFMQTKSNIKSNVPKMHLENLTMRHRAQNRKRNTIAQIVYACQNLASRSGLARCGAQSLVGALVFGAFAKHAHNLHLAKCGSFAGPHVRSMILAWQILLPRLSNCVQELSSIAWSYSNAFLEILSTFNLWLFFSEKTSCLCIPEIIHNTVPFDENFNTRDLGSNVHSLILVLKNAPAEITEIKSRWTKVIGFINTVEWIVIQGSVPAELLNLLKQLKHPERVVTLTFYKYSAIQSGWTCDPCTLFVNLSRLGTPNSNLFGLDMPKCDQKKIQRL